MHAVHNWHHGKGRERKRETTPIFLLFLKSHNTHRLSRSHHKLAAGSITKSDKARVDIFHMFWIFPPVLFKPTPIQFPTLNIPTILQKKVVLKMIFSDNFFYKQRLD
jgi:hypothetical protein